MDSVNIRKEDQILMSLVHYFVTKENYSPILVQGVKDEIWLEKLDGPYRVIRINSNKIFNQEQFDFDQLRIQGILKQIKKKTMSFKINVLNINLNKDDDVDVKDANNINSVSIKSLDDVKKSTEIVQFFPNIESDLYQSNDGLELIYNVTKDINERTERENKKFRSIFQERMPYVTLAIIAMCIVAMMGQYIRYGPVFTNAEFLAMGANNVYYIRESTSGLFRLISYAFIHGGLMHLLMNMYSLYIIGPQLESRFGHVKFAIIYLISAICGGLLSSGMGNVISVGASGAIFGLLGAMVYFGMKYRLYLKEALTTRIIPVIALNLIVGFMLSGIDNACHIGGLIGGYFAAMLVGIPATENKKDRINGAILLLIYTAFLVYLALFK